jgi:NAD-dependent dihydropyrimidine dehydrogenase PreA subunit/flavodoxin
MIFFFSGTGNTRWAAERIAEATGERLLFIPDELKGPCTYQLADGERVGFCFPVHGWQPPRIVRRFIRKMQLNGQASYCYALVTCGDSIGRTMEMLSKELAAKALHLDGRFSLVMPESYVCLPFMYTDTPERERQKIIRAGSDLRRYIPMIVDRRRGEVHTKRGLTPWTFSHVIGAYFNGHMITDRKFTVDADTCIHCGKCEEVCPTGDVALNADRLPEWHHDDSCTCCLACYHHCPRHAINYGSITRSRGQYYFKAK